MLLAASLISSLLLPSGAPVNCLNAEAGTALYAASLAGHKEVVDLLLKRGADPSLCSLNGSSPLMVAASEGYLEIIQALLKNGSKVDDKDESVSTADGSVFVSTTTSDRLVLRV